jgi:hypothetical protein
MTESSWAFSSIDMEYKSDIFETDNRDVFRCLIFTQDRPGWSPRRVHLTSLGLPCSLCYKFSYNFLKVKVFCFWGEKRMKWDMKVGVHFVSSPLVWLSFTSNSTHDYPAYFILGPYHERTRILHTLLFVICLTHGDKIEKNEIMRTYSMHEED